MSMMLKNIEARTHNKIAIFANMFGAKMELKLPDWVKKQQGKQDEMPAEEEAKFKKAQAELQARLKPRRKLNG